MEKARGELWGQKEQQQKTDTKQEKRKWEKFWILAPILHAAFMLPSHLKMQTSQHSSS